MIFPLFSDLVPDWLSSSEFLLPTACQPLTSLFRFQDDDRSHPQDSRFHPFHCATKQHVKVLKERINPDYPFSFHNTYQAVRRSQGIPLDNLLCQFNNFIQ